MSSDDDGSAVVGVRLNPKLCARLRQRLEPACTPPRQSLKPLVGNAVVQRIRQQNHQLALQEFLAQPEPAPRVSQEDALDYFARRAYNSLCSREMLAKEAKEASRLRREPFTQALAKDISRRHFRTAKRYDTGSKYHPPPADGCSGRAGGGRGLHGREAREPLLTLLRSRKLVAMADVLLAHPGSVRVGPQPTSPAAGDDDDDSAGDAAGADSRDGSRCGRGRMAPPEDRRGDNAAARVVPVLDSELAVPSLDATRYALALFSPRRRGGGAAGDAPAAAAAAAAAADGCGAPWGNTDDGAATERPARRLPDAGEDAGSATTDTSADGQRARSLEGGGHAGFAGRHTASRTRSAGEAADNAGVAAGGAPPAAASADGGGASEAGEDCRPADTAEGGAADAAALARRERPRSGQEDGRGSDEDRGGKPAAAAVRSPSSSPPVRPAPAGSEAVADCSVLPSSGSAGRLGEAMPPRVQQRLMGDRLQELLAASRSLFAQAEGLLDGGSPLHPDSDDDADGTAALPEAGASRG